MMRLRRFFARFRWPVRRQPARGAASRSRAAARATVPVPPAPAAGRHRRDDRPQPAAGASAAAQPATDAAPFASPVQESRTRPPGRPSAGARGRSDTAARGASRQAAAAKVAVRTAPGAAGAARPAAAAARASAAQQASANRLPWYEVANARKVAGGLRDCGPLEKILCRDWDEATLPPAEVVRAIDRLAELPATVAQRLAEGLDAIYVGPGGVPDLDDMSRLHGVPLPSGRATWDACAGAYGDRKIIIGTRPSATPDVVCHEVGHALDELDGFEGMWQSDSDGFRALYDRCLPHLVSDFHRQEGALGRREFFADAFAAIASRQRPALVDMLGGDTRIAMDVMLFFNVRYQI